jgi:hypothetical protein
VRIRCAARRIVRADARSVACAGRNARTAARASVKVLLAVDTRRVIADAAGESGRATARRNTADLGKGSAGVTATIHPMTTGRIGLPDTLLVPFLPLDSR